MNLFRAVLILAALGAVVVQYLQEMRRTTIVKRLPGPQARDYFEATRQRGERLMVVITLALAAGAVTMVLRAFVLAR